MTPTPRVRSTALVAGEDGRSWFGDAPFSGLAYRVDDDGVVQARTAWQADDIDGITIVDVGAADAAAAGIVPGAFIDVRLDEVEEDVDFRATLVGVVSAPPAPRRAARALPIMTTAGSFGR